MNIYDFTFDFYFRDNYAIKTMIEYLKQKKRITQKEINVNCNIPKSNYRRAQQKDFIGYGKMVECMANYMGIPSKIDESIIRDLNENFNTFYTYICFSKFHEAKNYFDLITSNLKLYENSILIIPYYLAQFIYYLSDINYSNKINFEIIDEAVEILNVFVEKMSDEHRFLYYEYMTCYAGITKHNDNVIRYSQFTLSLSFNYPDLEPCAYYHISFAYSLISDFFNALIYANKALPKLEEQLNYIKAVFCRMNIATFYKKLGNIDEAKKMLKKNLIYLTFNDIPKLDRVTYLNYADCMLMEKNYSEALSYYLKIEDEITISPDYESIIIVYCLYQLNEVKRAEDYIEKLIKSNESKQYAQAYLSLVLFFKAFYNKSSLLEIKRKYKAAQEHMEKYSYRGSYIQDLANNIYIELTENKKITKTKRT